ncbi:predicted protein [Thalassiosira pseudonana CCMP1335]|uniref:Uncharacterized protein n=1 Tax=Thalassiosira pseudonana TaxID=35128 RepID=B8BTB2_THAPS|nr:predicted protein [Thalassiosira pseudonana CCMP1335]EED94572.1 predicted protein [Thalassiosira pseudonana CCMP1335]
MSNSAPISPDSRKKKPALPSLLSNLRNAATIVGGGSSSSRRASDHSEYELREARPLMVGNGGSGASGGGGMLGGDLNLMNNYGGDRSMKRSAATASTASATTPFSSSGLNSSTIRQPPISQQRTNIIPAANSSYSSSSSSSVLSSTLQSFSLRLENSWRKQRYSGSNNNNNSRETDKATTRKQQHHRGRAIRVSIPNTFLISSVCFFIGVPMIILLYVLARQSVFGDESSSSVLEKEVVGEHNKYEVPSFMASGDMEVLNGEQQGKEGVNGLEEGEVLNPTIAVDKMKDEGANPMADLPWGMDKSEEPINVQTVDAANSMSLTKETFAQDLKTEGVDGATLQQLILDKGESINNNNLRGSMETNVDGGAIVQTTVAQDQIATNSETAGTSNVHSSIQENPIVAKKMAEAIADSESNLVWMNRGYEVKESLANDDDDDNDDTNLRQSDES